MKHGFMLNTAAFLLIGTAALAQSSYSESSTTTTTTPPPVIAPAPVDASPVVPLAPGTLSTTETERASDGAGNSYESTKTTYGNTDGAAEDTSTTTTTVPPPESYVTTKRTVTTTTGGD